MTSAFLVFSPVLCYGAGEWLATLPASAGLSLILLLLGRMFLLEFLAKHVAARGG